VPTLVKLPNSSDGDDTRQAIRPAPVQDTIPAAVRNRWADGEVARNAAADGII
jgi:hypothetical protein